MLVLIVAFVLRYAAFTLEQDRQRRQDAQDDAWRVYRRQTESHNPWTR